MKFIEGETYEFEVLKLVDLPEEGEFYLLRHQTGRRLMLPFKSYQHYGIEPGKRIECKVDKVNCTGKVYLEPKHPYYRIGEEYNFEVVDIEKPNSNGLESFVVVIDVFNNRIRILNAGLSDSIESQRKINLRVENIKKGLPELVSSSFTINNDKFSALIGQSFDFLINRIEKNGENEDVYVLESELGYRAELKTRHFKSYELSIGKSISCSVYGYTNLGLLKVEPQNPWYIIGQSYEFDLQEIEPYGSHDDNGYLLILKDCVGNKCGAQVDANSYLHIKDKTRVKCRVVGFRKGRPKLELDLL